MIDITEEELNTLKDKAQKWDDLGGEIEVLYTTRPSGEEIPDDEMGMGGDEDEFDLVDIGEVAAIAYGWL